MIGTTVGSYRITQKVSVGGMGAVYRAEHTLIGKQAAVKLLHPELCNNREIVNRFFNEAKATTQIKHPGIVEVFDFGYLPSGHAYLVMEFLEGCSLANRLDTGDKMSEGEAAMILRAVCNALAAAHAKKIVHRDLKPDNIFLVPDPETATGIRPKILDFGIAKLTDIGPAGTATKTGSVMGTPTYMSPEQCRGSGEIDHRADLYSLGCIFYEIVCGQAPFVSEGAGELIGQHLFVEPEPPSKHQPGVSAETEQLIMSLLKKDPNQRPQTARDLGQRLGKIAQQSGWITRTSPSGITAVEPTPTSATEAKVPSGTSLGVPAPVQRDPSRPAVSQSRPVAAVTSALAEVPPEPELPKKTMSPTTLSGAASSIIDVPRKRRGIMIGAAGVFGVAAVIGFFVMTSGGSKDPAKPATEPAAAPVAPAPSVAPTPTPPPAPTPPAPPVETPPPVAPAVTTPPVTPPPAPPAHPAVQTKPVKPHATKPEVKPTKPDVKPIKPEVKPTKPGSGSGSGSAKPLIETDI